MQIKEFEAITLKECLQQVRQAMGPDAVILETRKFRRGGLMGFGARDAVAIVAATGITVTSDLPGDRAVRRPATDESRPLECQETSHDPRHEARDTRDSVRSDINSSAISASAMVAARGVYGPKISDRLQEAESRSRSAVAASELKTNEDPPRPEARTVRSERTGKAHEIMPDDEDLDRRLSSGSNAADDHKQSIRPAQLSPPAQRPASASPSEESMRVTFLERAMGEIRECLHTLQREQRESHDRTVSAVVAAVAPAVTAVNAAGLAALADDPPARFPELRARMKEMCVSDELTEELFDQLPDMGAWSGQAQQALAISAMKDLVSRRVSSRGGIELTPGRLKAVALIGPTGVGKTTTIAKLAAHFALMQGKKVALLTVDTYRIAAIEQLKTYSEIIGLPMSVAYNHAEVPPILDEYADYDLILIDTAGRSQKHIMQIGELKSLLDTVNCETHLVLSAPIKEQDMMESARRFSAARVDRLIFSKLDETSSYGTLLNVADRTGIPLSYLTTGQKVPEDIEVAEGTKLATLILD